MQENKYAFRFYDQNLHRIHWRISFACGNQEFVSAWRTGFDHLLLDAFDSQVILNRNVNLFLFWNGSVVINVIKLSGTQISGLSTDCLSVPTLASYSLSCLLGNICLSCFSPPITSMALKDFVFTYFVYEKCCWSMNKVSKEFQVSRGALCLYAQKYSKLEGSSQWMARWTVLFRR